MPVRTAAALGALLLVVLVVYAHVTGSGWCGYDDFHESYRAQFFDGRDPSRIFTSVHFQPFMYRPITSALQLGTWNGFEHSALSFRIRGLVMHLVAIVAVFGIGSTLARSRAVGLGAASLFAFNPEGNEAVVVAIWTNTTAYALFLGALYFFLLAVRLDEERRPWAASLGAFAVLAFLALFTYEPTIAIFAVGALYLLTGLGARTPQTRSFLIAAGAASGLEIGAFFIIRHLVGVGSAPMLPALSIAKHLAQYVGALVLPIDFVLAHDLFAIPFPSRVAPVHVRTMLPLFAASLAIAIAVALIILRPGSNLGTAGDRRNLLFLAVSAPLVLGPIVPFRPQVSEFNLYLPAAFWCVFLCLLIARVARSRTRYAVAVAVLLVPAIAGVWVRNERVVGCAQIVDRIHSGLPTASWHSGSPHVELATAPGVTLSPRFGTYDYGGIEAIDVAGSGILGAQSALRLWTDNENLEATVVPSETLARGCPRGSSCFYIWPDGRVEREPSS